MNHFDVHINAWFVFVFRHKKINAPETEANDEKACGVSLRHCTLNDYHMQQLADSLNWFVYVPSTGTN